ncbi:unnamed protein product [Paramecium primaurelia]|uniref:Uncharacterized protein n=1 Tax=Paramecium primaurelia TaxID=5886 RepID=A0A8S1JLW6_PARPR|nr:unnamed protein product [Paramecium primaurelia]
MSSCQCLDCGGRINKKILISKKELNDPIQSNSKLRFPISPQLSIQPQYVRPSNRDLSLVGSPSHFSIILFLFLCEKHSKQIIQKSNRVSVMPVIQLIKAQNLMKKVSETHKIEKEIKTKMSISTHNLFNKVQQKMIINNNHNTDKLKYIQVIENKNSKEITNKLHKYTSNCGQFRIKTESYNYNFASNNQKISVINIPNLTHLENLNKNSISIYESKTPRLFLARSETYNLKQPLTQRLMCTYLKKLNINSKLIKNNNKV